MRIGILIFARLSSTRLPRKALADIAGRTLVGRVLDRARRIDVNGPVVLATSDDRSDDELVELAKRENIACFRGSLADVAGRALAAAKWSKLDAFARVCGDRPFFDPELVARLAGCLEEQNLDLATNCVGQTFPPGLTAEVVSTASLERALPEMTEPGDREHVTQYFYRSIRRFRIFNESAPDWLTRTLSFAVDTRDDLERAAFIAKATDRDDGIPASQEGIHAAALRWAEMNRDL